MAVVVSRSDREVVRGREYVGEVMALRKQNHLVERMFVCL
jgi:hypothetical protein